MHACMHACMYVYNNHNHITIIITIIIITIIVLVCVIYTKGAEGPDIGTFGDYGGGESQLRSGGFTYLTCQNLLFRRRLSELLRYFSVVG